MSLNRRVQCPAASSERRARWQHACAVVASSLCLTLALTGSAASQAPETPPTEPATPAAPATAAPASPSASPGSEPSSEEAVPSTPAQVTDASTGSVADGSAAASVADVAADDARAKELYLRGDRRYAEGDYEAAVVAFAEAYRLSGRPALLFNLANAFERLGRYEQALDHLERYAAHAPAHQQERVAKRIASLKARAERLQARAREVAPSARATEIPSPRPALGASTDASGPGVTSALGAKAGGGTEATEEPELPIVGYTLLGVGALSVGASVLFAIASADARDRADQHCEPGPAGALCLNAAADAIDEERRNALGADLSIGLGIAALAIGTVLVLDSGGTDEGAASSASAELRVGPTAGGGRVDVVGTF